MPGIVNDYVYGLCEVSKCRQLYTERAKLWRVQILQRCLTNKCRPNLIHHSTRRHVLTDRFDAICVRYCHATKTVALIGVFSYRGASK